MSSTKRTLLLFLPIAFLLSTAVAITFLERTSKNAFYSHLSRNERNGAFELILPGQHGSQETSITHLDVNDGPIYALLGLCTLVYGMCALSAAGMWQLRRVQDTAGHERAWVWVLGVGNLVLVAAGVAAFVYGTSVQGSERKWESLGDVGMGDQEHTRETWVCGVQEFFPEEGWAGKACGMQKAMRFLMLGLMGAAVLVLGSVAVVVRGRGGWKWVGGGRGRYAGFQGVYEMQTPGMSVPYVGAQGGQWMQQPGHGQPVQQWVPQTYQPIQQMGSQPVLQHAAQPVAQPIVGVPKSDATVSQRPMVG
ncbi:hypothetical protein P3342_002327 [Pyrenophora teres f. teres]|uniref:Uncharacterized protein n=2 Tax=Pyrenophora teres f. teres TaxID=97479 RepID=E3RVD1_PYRTT|nr:hypothetical protein PTT_13122 [Pyrenophora teres f. teres 0-1]KAK1920031.1 hypothetical protein P3342_002327 [Pyrenophora teres f. teres]CAE7179378.1 hypothetical protein PTTW11_06534 [Pyrenophora teres f. teres]